MFGEWPTAEFESRTTDFLPRRHLTCMCFTGHQRFCRQSARHEKNLSLEKTTTTELNNFFSNFVFTEIIKIHSGTAMFLVTNLKILNLSENITWSRKGLITKFTLSWNFSLSIFFGSNQKYQRDSRLAPVYLSPHYKYFDQLSQTQNFSTIKKTLTDTLMEEVKLWRSLILKTEVSPPWKLFGFQRKERNGYFFVE